MMHDELIDRALSLLAFMDVRNAVVHLVQAGVDFGEAFLACHAAEILVKYRA